MTAVQLRDGASGGVYDSPPGVHCRSGAEHAEHVCTLGEKSGFAAAPALFPDLFWKKSCVIKLVQDVPWDIKGECSRSESRAILLQGYRRFSRARQH